MQVFHPFQSPTRSAQILDRKRVFKQCVETIQILKANLGQTKGWVNHPVTKMWKGCEPYLFHVYLRAFLQECVYRDFDMFFLFGRVIDLQPYIPKPKTIQTPDFITEDYLTHQKNILIEKNPHYYQPIFENEK